MANPVRNENGRSLLLDHMILDKFCKGQRIDFYNKVQGLINKETGINARIPIMPYSTIELSGINISEIVSITENKNLFNRNDSTDKVLEKTIEFYKKRLETDNLKHLLLKKLERQKDYFQHYGKEILQIHLQALNDQSYIDEIKTTILVDYISEHDYTCCSEEKQREIYLKIMFFLLYWLGKRKNISLYRIVVKNWDCLKKDPKLKKKNPEMKAELSQMTGMISSKIKNGEMKDKLDSDLVHLSLMGHFLGEKQKPVHCYTCENEKSILAKISSYNTKINFFKKEFSCFSIPDFKSGKIFIVDNNSGILKKKICTKKWIIDRFSKEYL